MRTISLAALCLVFFMMAPATWTQNFETFGKARSLPALKSANRESPSLLAAASGALPSGYVQGSSLARKALRFEILGVGAFPLMLFYTDIGFGIGRYAVNGFDPRYAPWPFRNSSSILPDDGERLLRIGVAAGISCAIALYDLISSLIAEASARSAAELDSDPPRK